ncbi:Auxin-responsive protein [Hordeum vulgare]|nr:Auxin-responsive protein [Hordeum vulgare]KAE8799568.1 Auxin-responsive protein [Hordeum vulgare]
MPVRAPEAGSRSWQIDLDSAEDDDDPPPRTVMDKKIKASHSTRRSLRLNDAVDIAQIRKFLLIGHTEYKRIASTSDRRRKAVLR